MTETPVDLGDKLKLEDDVTYVMQYQGHGGAKLVTLHESYSAPQHGSDGFILLPMERVDIKPVADNKIYAWHDGNGSGKLVVEEAV